MKAYEEFDSPLHGRGVRACRSITKGEVIFYEKPYHLLQTLPNRQLVLTCASCYRPLGSTALQLKLLQKEITRQNVMNEINSIGKLPYEDIIIQDSQGLNIFPCSAACGEYYCSAQCRDDHWYLRGHCLLCTGSISDEDAENHPLINFKMHAVNSNEIFLMVAELFATICIQLDKLIESGTILQDAIRIVDSPFHGYVKQLWWEAAKCPADSNQFLFKNTLKRLVNESWTLLNEVLQLSMKGYDSLLNQEYMSRTIGMFEQNNVGVQLQTPLSTYINRLCLQSDTEEAMVHLDKDDEAFGVLHESVEMIIDSLEDGDACCEVITTFNEEEEEESENDEDENVADGRMKEQSTDYDQLQSHLEDFGIETLFPPFDGTAFYLLICRINHSCDPNIMVKYCISDEAAEGLKGLNAYTIALKDIAEGEEFVQSYIDQFESYEVRQEALQDYGFHCNCSKCSAEARTT